MSKSDYLRRFGGIARLYGQDKLESLSQAHVVVVGVGGVGSWAVEALVRSGVGKLTLIDLDNIAVSNTNRQLHALTPDFGKAKVSALHERILQINPSAQVIEIEDFVDSDNVQTIFSRSFDFVIDAIDQIYIKAKMIEHFMFTKQAFIISGGAGGKRYRLRKQYGFPRQGKMRVPCVFSRENMTLPKTEQSCDQGSPQGLSCAGYGASMLVTASFGLYCAHAAIEHIVKNRSNQ